MKFLRLSLDLVISLIILAHWQLPALALRESVSARLRSRLLRNSTSPSATRPYSARLGQRTAPASGITYIGSIGNKSFYTDPEKMGVEWAEALDYCHEQGLQPASVEKLAEHKLVRNYLANLPHRFFWLAGTDFFQEGHWKWMKTGENFKFSKWTQGYPTHNRKNNCIYLSYGNDGWIDASCSSNKLIIRPLCQSQSV